MALFPLDVVNLGVSIQHEPKAQPVMDLFSVDPLAWRDSDAMFAAGMQQYPFVSDEHHHKPSVQEPAMSVVMGSGDLGSIYQSSYRHYQSGLKGSDQLFMNYSMKSPLSTTRHKVEDEGVLGQISPVITNTLSSSFQPLLEDELLRDYHTPVPMIAASSLVSSMGCSNVDCGSGSQITQQVENAREMCGDSLLYDPTFEGPYAIQFGAGLSPKEELLSCANGSPAKTAIKTHPLYPYLVAAHIDCYKIGAEPADIKNMEEAHLKHQEIQPKNCFRPSADDKQLDTIMAWYLRMLIDLKGKMEELFFLEKEWCSEVFEKLRLLGPSSSPAQMTGLEVKGRANPGDKEGHTLAFGEARQQSRAPTFDQKNGMIVEQAKQEKVVKEWLRSKHDRSQIYSLRGQCKKKRRQGKHPQTAREQLVEWFNGHGEWPYPSEEEKLQLAEQTKLEARQINNWFINQRKRHWDSPTKEEPNHQVLHGIKSYREIGREQVGIDRFYVPLDGFNPS